MGPSNTNLAKLKGGVTIKYIETYEVSQYSIKPTYFGITSKGYHLNIDIMNQKQNAHVHSSTHVFPLDVQILRSINFFDWTER